MMKALDALAWGLLSQDDRYYFYHAVLEVLEDFRGKVPDEALEWARRWWETTLFQANPYERPKIDEYMQSELRATQDKVLDAYYETVRKLELEAETPPFIDLPPEMKQELFKAALKVRLVILLSWPLKTAGTPREVTKAVEEKATEEFWAKVEEVVRRVAHVQED